jgi:hypothetical protein
MRTSIYALVLLLAVPAFAQSADEVAQNAADRAPAFEIAGSVIADPSLTTTAAQPHSQLSLVSSNEGDTLVKAEIGYKHAVLKADWNYGLRVQGPVNKGGGETKLASLSGLGTGSTAGIHITRVGYGKNFNPDVVATFCDEYDRNNLTAPPRINVETECTETGIQAKIDRWAGSEKQKKVVQEEFEAAVRTAAVAVCEAYNKSGAGPLILCDKTTEIRTSLAAAAGWPQKLEAKLNEDLPDFCARLNTETSLWGLLGGLDGCDTDDVARVSKTLAADLDRRIKLQLTMFSFGVDIQNQAFKFASGASLDETKETHQNLGVATSFGRYFVGPEWYVSVGAAIERVFQGGTPQQICGPIADTNLTTCKTIARTAPTHEDNEIVTLEARHFITKNIAIQPRLSHDFADDVSAAELIFYFFEHDKKGLNGGVNLGYRDDEDDPTLTVFIGGSFDLFGGN